MDRYFDKVDDHWRALPLRKQYKYLLYCFLAYLILTIAVILKVWYDKGKSNHSLVIEHIENPVVKKRESTRSLQDSMLKIIKNRRHERK